MYAIVFNTTATTATTTTTTTTTTLQLRMMMVVVVVVVVVLAPADSIKQHVPLNDRFEGLTILLGIESSG